MNASIEFLTEQLKQKGIRPSFQRIKVLEYLFQKGGHPTVDEIFRALSPTIPSLSKATIYNTLHALVGAGLAQGVEIDEVEMHYDVTLTSHGHFQCENCAEIYNFEVNIDQVDIDGLKQFEITQKNVYFKGLCPNCLNKSTSRDKEKPK